MYRSILVPLDGSMESEQALPVARSIALQAHAPLHLVHVHVPSQIIYIDGLPVIDEALHSLNREHEQAYLQTLAQRLLQYGDLAITAANLEGSIVPTLLRHAAATSSDLIVMTSHGRSGLVRAWLGGVADALIRQSPVPMLLLRPQAAPLAFDQPVAFQQILLPLDGSPLAEQMLEPALALGQLMQAQYRLLHVVTPGSSPDQTPLGYMPEHSPELLRQQQTEAQRYLDGVAHRLRATGLPVAAKIAVDSQPAARILAEARQQGVDLIALTTHGRSGLQRLLVGSVADKVVRGAEIPVLLYRPQESQQHGR